MKVDLPALGRPTRPGIGKQFQPQPDPYFLAGQPVPCWRGARLVDGLVAGIAAAAVAAAQEDDLLAFLGEIGSRCDPRHRPAPGCRSAP
jgi:hypothetical protein